MARKQPKLVSSRLSTKQISFHLIDISFVLRDKNILRTWILSSAKAEKREIDSLNFCFCSDKFLLKMNREHLQHDYYTDIITFDLSDNKKLSADIYISIDRVRDNAHINLVSFKNELRRVMIHGVLHLCGYKDKKARDIQVMRMKEDYYLSLLP